MTSELPKLETVGLHKSYGPAVALQSTDLAVRKGEFLTLLGPSGSGKTTLLMMIAGLTPPSGGRVFVDGADITSRPPYERNLGVVFQNYALFPHMSVEDNVAFPLRMRRLPKGVIAAEVKAALSMVRLDHLATRLPAELSGGQQQRVAFARAIVFKPSLVLMDEPLGALDKKLRDELKGEIRRLHRELGTTIVYVTHDQDEAMMLSDRICLMNDARVVQVDTPSTLYNKPATPFAAAFIGESNLLPAHVLRVEGGRAEVSLGDTGERWWSTAPGSVAAGTRVSALVRPERIGIHVAGPIAPATNTSSAQIRSITNLGGILQIVCALASGTELKMAMLGRPDLPFGEGAMITIVVPEADVIPLADPLGSHMTVAV